jgi:hypothetical protein
LGAVAAQKLAVGLKKISFHRSHANAVFTHQLKAGLKVDGERHEDQRDDQQNKYHRTEGE